MFPIQPNRSLPKDGKKLDIMRLGGLTEYKHLRIDVMEIEFGKIAIQD